MNSQQKTLAAIRTEKGRSIRELAEHLEVDRGTIDRLERGYYLTHDIARANIGALYRFYGPALYRYLSAGNLEKTIKEQ